MRRGNRIEPRLERLQRLREGTEVPPIEEKFVRLDDSVFKLPFTQDRIGDTVYFKFQSFNIYGGGVQDLASLGAYPYVIQGSALASPFPRRWSMRTAEKSASKVRAKTKAPRSLFS